MVSDQNLPALTIDAGIATIRLRRPHKRNRIEPNDIETIIAACDQVNNDPDVRVFILRSEGPVWCSGYHLGALAASSRPRYGFGQLCDHIERLKVPSIAAATGGVYGGGTDLALACDFRVGTPDVVAMMPAAKIGLQYYASGLRRFVERIGPDATKRMFLTAELLDAAELFRLGFLTEVVATSEFETRLTQLIAAISGLAPQAVIATKAAINQISAATADLELIEAGYTASLDSYDHGEALTALAEKRPPRFKGC